MDPFSSLIGLTGRWRGKYRLIVEPGQPARESESTAVVAPIAGGRFVRIDYAGSPSEKPSTGCAPKKAVRIAWATPLTLWCPE